MRRAVAGGTGSAGGRNHGGVQEPAKKRYELDFVKAELGAKNALVVIYGVRVTDARDYRTKAKEFLDQKSMEVGRAVGEFRAPDVGKLPRRVF